ncbi:CFEM domain-containing protein, partial [Plectosphaerella plurivora]
FDLKLVCLTQAVGRQSHCTATDAACICNSPSIQADAQGCMMERCTPRELLTTLNISSRTCHLPVRDRSKEYMVISIVLCVISTIIAVMRVVFVAMTSTIKFDDICVILTSAIIVSVTVFNNVRLEESGLGKDIWMLGADDLTAFGRWFYIMQILYFSAIALLKLAILTFFLRIFQYTPIKIPIIMTIIFSALFGIIFVVIAIFLCSPISYFWTKWDEEHEGSCMNINAFAWANGAISISLDIWMLVLPLLQISSMNLKWQKKLGVALMFGVGTFVTIVSILRLVYLVTNASTQNPSWEQFDAAKWSTIEINVGVICVCMPTMRLILVQFFPRLTDWMRSMTGRAKKGDRHRSRTKVAGKPAAPGESILETMVEDGTESTGNSQNMMTGTTCTGGLGSRWRDDEPGLPMRDLGEMSDVGGTNTTDSPKDESG